MISHEHDNLIPDEQIEETHVQNPLEENDTIVTRKSKRQRIAKSFGDDYIVYLVDNTPTSIEEAFSSPDADLWKEAVRSEMESIMSNGTWEVVDRPYGCKCIGCCRMDLPGPTTLMGTRTEYSVGPWDYLTCAARYLMA
jgi:hypothetical protein